VGVSPRLLRHPRRFAAAKSGGGGTLSLFSRARSQQLIPSPSASSAALPSADLDPFPENRPAAGMERVFVTKVAKQEGQGDACYWLRVQNLGSGALRLTIVDKTEAQSWTAEVCVYFYLCNLFLSCVYTWTFIFNVACLMNAPPYIL